ncbi:MAG: PorV/PorQ family protein, partial [Prevotellaceae bacterium]|nr:PorV/PorQ family protein [Prevotellaceae bacterium]
SNEFLSVGVGARALGMGGAASVTATDACAAYWNPSLLTALQPARSVALMHAEYFAGVAKYDFGAFAYRLDSTTAVAATLIRFGVDDILNTTDLIDKDGNFSYDRLSYFSTADYAFAFSLAKKVKIAGRTLDLGANAKIVYRNVGKFAAAYGFGVDLGAHYTLGRWSLGVMLRDVTTTVNVWTYNGGALEIPPYVMPSGDTITNSVPSSKTEVTLPKITLGAAYSVRFNKDFSMQAEAGLDFTTDGQRNVLVSTKWLNIDPKLGVEGSYKNMVYLRAGISNVQRISDFGSKSHISVQPSIGIGLSIIGFALDYALTNIGSTGVSTYSNVFSISYGF